MSDEHRMDLIIKRKEQNYYRKIDEYDNIKPEQVILIADKYVEKSTSQIITDKIKGLKESEGYKRVNERVQPLHLFKRKEYVEDK